MKPLMPSENGFKCDHCDFVTDDIFEFLHHNDEYYGWSIKISPRYSLDLFSLFSEISANIREGDPDQADRLVQSATLAMVNASEGNDNIEKFIHEAMISITADELANGVEELLKKEAKKDDDK